jgi:hypothetical protein
MQHHVADKAERAAECRIELEVERGREKERVGA